MPGLRLQCKQCNPIALTVQNVCNITRVDTGRAHDDLTAAYVYSFQHRT